MQTNSNLDFFHFYAALAAELLWATHQKKFQKKKKKRLSVKSEKDKKSHPRMRRCWLDGIRSFPEQKSPVLFFLFETIVGGEFLQK